MFKRKKSIKRMQANVKTNQMKKTLSLWQLVAIGLGGIIGVGVFVLTGQVAHDYAGPGVALSFIIAGLCSAAAALCYAEFSGLIPVAGSAYTYSYAVLGEFFAWFIGWDILLEYTLVVSVVAIGWAGYFGSILDVFGIHLPVWAQGAMGTGDGHVFNVLAFIVSMGMAILLSGGMKMAAKFNTWLVIIKIAAILLIIIAGSFFINKANWHPFMPHGFGGVMTGASIVFFAVFGYDTLTTAAEEAKNPRRDLPLAVMISLVIALILYVCVTLVITGMVPLSVLGSAAPVADAFKVANLPWIGFIIAISAVVGITSVIFSFLLGASRIWFSMSRDGLLPAYFSKLHAKYKTPHRTTLIVGLVSGTLAGLFPLGVISEMVNIGTLSAFFLICASIIVLRVQQPNLPRKFKTPLVPFIPIVGMVSCLLLMIELPLGTWIRFIIWLAIGLVVYYTYGVHHSKVKARLEQEKIG